MCKIDWVMLHKYIETLIWPLFLLGILWIFRKKLDNLVNRITEESEKIEIPGIFTVTLRQVEKIKKESKEKNIKLSEETQQLISNTVLTQLEGIKQLGEEYTHSTFDQRRIIESRIKEFSIGLSVEDIDSILESKDTGHRIAAAMVLDSIVYRNNLEPFENEKVKKFLTDSIEDSNSFLRYEALQVILSSSRATREFKNKLESMKNSDKNSAIRNILKLYLK